MSVMQMVYCQHWSNVMFFSRPQETSRLMCTECELLTLTVSHTETFYVQYNMLSRWLLFLIFHLRHNLRRIHLEVKNIYPKNILSVLCRSFWDDILMLSSLMCATEYQRFNRFKDVTLWRLREFLPCSSNEAGERSLYSLK